MFLRTLLSPAKLNLSLRLRGRRPDGYHLLESTLIMIDLYDRLDVGFTRTPSTAGIEVVSGCPDVPPGRANIIYRAAATMRDRTGVSFSLSVNLDKRIPMGSGLGGGSSNAATILQFLNGVLGSPFSLDGLAEVGAEIGADVPFFIYGKAAFVRGIGEIVEPMTVRRDVHVVVCSAGIPLSTVVVYAEADRMHASTDSDSLTSAWPESNILSFVDGRRPLTGLLANDLEEAAVHVCPEVRLLKSELVRLGAQGASMTGSGSAVFGLCSDAETAGRIAAALREQGVWAVPAKALGASS